MQRYDEIDLKNEMKRNYSYPDYGDEDMQSKLYKKRELYYHKTPVRPQFKTEKEIKDYRENMCSGEFELADHQKLISNIINPNTPFKGLILFHGLGTGKTSAGSAVGEGFKEQVERFGNRIHVLVTGPILKEDWKESIIKSAESEYLPPDFYNLNDEKQKRELKNARNKVLKYYNFMSHLSFYKKVLGEKITERIDSTKSNSKVIYKKNELGEFERDIGGEKIDNLNNTLLIVDEAHIFTNNQFGDALQKIINNSVNLKILLLSATPMKNLATDIVPLVNFLRPQESPIDKDKIFTKNRVDEIEIKPGGLEYFRKMVKGYVSYLRGNDPLIFAKRVDKGIKTKGLEHIKIIPCYMSKFQKEKYDEIVGTKDYDNDKTLGSSITKSSIYRDVSNFVFPIINSEGKLDGTIGINGYNQFINQVKNNKDELNKKICQRFFENSNYCENINMVENSYGRNLSGKIAKFPYLKLFSTKFYQVIKNLNNLFVGSKGPQTAFIYSNIVVVGVELFKDILLQNGYLEYQSERSNYQINSDTKCYYCGKTFSEHSGQKNNDDDKLKIKKNEVEFEKDDDNNKKNKINTDEHIFEPATFITITGSTGGDEEGETLSSEKKSILDNVFNSPRNRNGRYIKFIIGSKVVNVGINLMNVGEVHVLDVHNNLANLDQAVGRAIRRCSHYEVMKRDKLFPQVDVYKYAVSLKENHPSVEEELYRKGEKKYVLIKKIENIMKEEAIDCPLLYNSNVFDEDKKKNNEDFFKCSEKILNNKYYDPNRNIYKNLQINKIDNSTFTSGLARDEINFAKERIKELYINKPLYNINEIVDFVKQNYPDEKKQLFDDFFVYKALDELIPVSENDFNNFKDPITDKFNNTGYLIYVDDYYIFQPFDLNEKAPLYYRSNFGKKISSELTLKNFMHQSDKFKNLVSTESFEEEKVLYDFETSMEYYNTKNEFKYVGIIDIKPDGKPGDDDFKLREKMSKIIDKKRGVGIQSLKGAVCHTAKNRKYLEKVANYIGIKNYGKNPSRIHLCNLIKNNLFLREKYSSSKNNDKMTYLIIPANHPYYPFPYNLEDRTNKIINDLEEKSKNKFPYNIKTVAKTSGEEKGYPSYYIQIPKGKISDDIKNLIIAYNGSENDNNWIIEVK